MIPVWFAAVLAGAGMITWMLSKPDFNLLIEWKETLKTAVVVAALWGIWFYNGYPVFNWEAGQFNVGVFFLAWQVPSFLDHILPQVKKLLP